MMTTTTTMMMMMMMRASRARDLDGRAQIINARSCDRDMSLSRPHGPMLLSRFDFAHVEQLDKLHVECARLGAGESPILVKRRRLRPTLQLAQTRHNTASAVFAFVAVNDNRVISHV
jgi:hypothetical protein